MSNHVLARKLVGLFLAAPLTVASAQTLSYVERSTGLNQPGMEAGPTELEFGDVNGDGHPDLVSVGDHGSPYVNTTEHGVMVWFGAGTGTWSVFQYGNFGYGGVGLGDVNNDGLMDVGYGVHHNYSGVDLGNQILEVALGDGTGQFWTAWDDGLATNGEDWGMFGTDFADFDGDGDLDVASVSFGCCNGTRVYRNNGNGSWTQTFAASGGNSPQLLQVADFNGDGFHDLATSVSTGTAYFGNGAGGFSLGDGDLPAPSSSGRSGLSIGDVTDDGRDDIAYVLSSGIRVYTWLSPGHWQNISGALSNIGGAQLTQIADMNLDGHGDVLVYFLGNTKIYAGDGLGGWTLAATVTSPAACDFAALRAGTDFDHNGYPDFAFVAEENCQPWTGGTNHLHAFAEASVPTTPWVWPKYPRGGETLLAKSVRFIDWHAAVPSGSGQPMMSIEISTQGSGGPFWPVVAGVPNSGRFQWRLPGWLPSSANCYLRYTLATDPPAEAVTPAAFTIVNNTPLLAGDTNCDGQVGFGDINPFVLTLTDPASYGAAFPNCPLLNADVSGNGQVGFDDINPFVALLSGAPR